MILRYTKDNKIDICKKDFVEFVRAKYTNVTIPNGDSLKVVINHNNGNIELSWVEEGSIRGC